MARTGNACPRQPSPPAATLPQIPSVGHIVAHPRGHRSSGKQVNTIHGSGGAHDFDHGDVVTGAEGEYRWRSEARSFTMLRDAHFPPSVRSSSGEPDHPISPQQVEDRGE